MTVKQDQLKIRTTGRSTREITEKVADFVVRSGLKQGLCHVFIHHTSASLLLCENIDPQVRTDLEAFMSRLVPDGDPIFGHTAEGPDDMSAHIRTILATSALTIPVTEGRMELGRYQGIYLWEHRFEPHLRSVTVTIYGE